MTFAGVRKILAALLFAALLVPSFSQADDEPARPEPPVRLKKKKKPQPIEEEPEKAPEKRPAGNNPDEPKVGDKKGAKKSDEQPKLRRPGEDDDPAAPADDGEDAKETVARVAKNMRASEDRLAKKDPGEATRGIQRDILKDLDKLIEDSKRQQQQQQQSSSSSSSSRRQQQNAGNKKDRNQTAKKGGQKPKEGSGKKEGKDKDGKDKQAKGGGGDSKKEGSKIADLYKDIWGHYPETMRQEMDTYSREQFMEKYKGLLKQYYSTLSEKARSKENE